MQFYTLSPTEIKSFIECELDPAPHIKAAEFRLDVYKKFPQIARGTIVRGDVLKTKPDGNLLVVKERKPGDLRAFVKLSVKRSSWGDPSSLSISAGQLELGCPGRESWYEPDELTCPHCKTELSPATQVSTDDERQWRVHPATGRITIFKQMSDSGITILGADSKMHVTRRFGSTEVLMLLEPGARFRLLCEINPDWHFKGLEERVVVYDYHGLRVGKAGEVDAPPTEAPDTSEPEGDLI